MTGLQVSLFDDSDVPVLEPLAPQRTHLGRGAWIDLQPGWLSGGDEVLQALLERVDWRAERRQMYDRVVDVPRLTRFLEAHQPLPHPSLVEARESLSQHYADELGEPFVTAGLCLYRNERDSVAWHGDRIGRSREEDTMVAILSVGSSRDLALRPVGGGQGRRITLGHGDLVVMGGSCQRTWDHAVPKVAQPSGPRVSVQFRVAGVR